MISSNWLRAASALFPFLVLVPPATERWGDDDSPELARIGATPAFLGVVAEGEAVPQLATLLPGTVVRVLERDGSRVHVALDGWVDAESVVAMPKEREPGIESDEPAKKEPELPKRPVHELALADHVGVVAAVVVVAGERKLRIELELRTAREEPVEVDGLDHGGRIMLFEQRTVFGARTRGPQLVVRDVEFHGGKALVEIEWSALGEKPPARLVVSGRAYVTSQRTLVGAATDVDL